LKRLEVDYAEIYLDNNATTPTLPQVREAMMEALEVGYGNASSAHGAGDRSRKILREAREKVAGIIGAIPEHAYLTSGGTEANNMVLLSVLSNAGCRRVVTTKVEHSSVLRACEYLAENGVDVVFLEPDSAGRFELDQVISALDQAPTALVSVQWVNNETGVIQQIETIGRICRERSVVFHTDAAQAVGKIPIEIEDLPIDLFSMTAHKIHGPQGIGALYIRNRDHVHPIIHGGPQESNLRPGTENLAGIVGFGAAAEHRTQTMKASLPKMTNLRNSFESSILDMIGDVRINGDLGSRVCNSTNLRFEGVDGQALVAQLDARGIRCSQSSACTNRRPEPSYVLRAMGLSEEEAFESVRFSFSELNTEIEVETAVNVIAENVLKLRDFAARLDDLSPRKVAS